MQSAFGVEHKISKAIRLPKKETVQDRFVVNEKMKTMTGHLKRAKELGKGKKNA